MYYSGIEPCDVLNGTGFRTVIWVSGCSLECKGCFNPNTHNPNYGTKYTQETQRYLLDCLSKDYIDGITITGGNPLENYNLDSVLSLINEIRILLPNKTIWLYTGFTWEEIFYPIVTSDLNLDRDKIIRDRQEIVKNVDILIDGRYIEQQRNINKKWAGSDNQRVIDVKESLKQKNIILYKES